jgi:fructose-1-phosphate kinase PfkB-like protein
VRISRVNCRTKKLDVSNLDLMLAVVELMFLNQFRLGGASLFFTAGGPTGEMIKNLLSDEGCATDPITVQNWTRESFVAVDDNTNSQYRFGFQDRVLSEVEKEGFF